MLLHDFLLSVSTADKIPVYSKEESSLKPGIQNDEGIIFYIHYAVSIKHRLWTGYKTWTGYKMRNSDYV